MVIGVDEVGRGAWAGPLVVGAVSLKKKIPGLTDSKKLSKKQREDLDIKIRKNAEFVGIGWVSASEVDDLGLTKATKLACQRAIDKAPKDKKIIIDGKINYLPTEKDVECVVDGDETVPEISAASIVAKVARDNFMTEQNKKFPGYHFDKNVGYGTKSHQGAIEKLGLTPIHRWSYEPIKKVMEDYET